MSRPTDTAHFDLFALVILHAEDMEVGSEFSLGLDLLLTDPLDIESDGLIFAKRALVVGATIKPVESSCWKDRAVMVVISRMSAEASPEDQ